MNILLITISILCLGLLAALLWLARTFLGTKAKAEIGAILERDLEQARQELENLRQNLQQSKTEAARLQERLHGFETISAQVEHKETELAELRREVAQRDKDVVQTRAECDAARHQLERYRAEEGQRVAGVRAEIEILSQKIFEEKTGRFKDLGISALGELVKPMRENLEFLRKSLEETEKNGAVRTQQVLSAMEHITQLNAKLGSQAEGLAKALKGDNKLVGDFGEVLLERLLEFSGLQRGQHFIEQGEGLGLKTPEGGNLKPDVLILLPENRCLVVDSKMSLASWSEAQIDDETLRTRALQALRDSVRAHVKNLASKPYTEALNSKSMITVDFKFLFVPIEAVFHTCLAQDADLYQYAFAQKVILVSPTTLLAVLTTVAHTWKQFEIGRNAQAISERAALMIDKFADFANSLEDVGKHLGKAQSSYEETCKRLTHGRSNLASQAKKLVDLGAKGSKELPKFIQAAEED